MNALNIAFTTANLIFTAVNVACAIYSAKQAGKQATTAYKQLELTSKQTTEIAQKQLEESYKPDYPTTMRLESIAHSIQRLDGTIKESLQNNK